MGKSSGLLSVVNPLPEGQVEIVARKVGLVVTDETVLPARADKDYPPQLQKNQALR